MAGSLVLVATPIGNLGDLSPRAVEVLASASVIACEDTRHTRKLLNHAGISGVPVIAVHEHNERESGEQIVQRIRSGETVALVTDAGMPAISDPGEKVVAAVAAAGLTVSVIPGPSAAPAAVAVSGFDSARWCFEGFLPRKSSERHERLSGLVNESRVAVLYESPQRLEQLADEMSATIGPSRRVVLVRELSKLHEEVWRGTVAELKVRALEGVKGECVVVIEGATSTADSADDVESFVRERLSAGDSPKSVTDAVVARHGLRKRDAFDLVQRLK